MKSRILSPLHSAFTITPQSLTAPSSPQGFDPEHETAARDYLATHTIGWFGDYTPTEAALMATLRSPLPGTGRWKRVEACVGAANNRCLGVNFDEGIIVLPKFIDEPRPLSCHKLYDNCTGEVAGLVLPCPAHQIDITSFVASTVLSYNPVKHKFVGHDSRDIKICDAKLLILRPHGAELYWDTTPQWA